VEGPVASDVVSGTMTSSWLFFPRRGATKMSGDK